MKPTYLNAPSIKSFAGIGVNKEKAMLCRKLIKGEIRITDNPLFPLANEWIKSCYRKPSRKELIHEALNEVIGEGEIYYNDIHQLFDLAGKDDIYSYTLVFNGLTNRFYIHSIGVLLEGKE